LRTGARGEKRPLNAVTWSTSLIALEGAVARVFFGGCTAAFMQMTTTTSGCD
jgi:hypothetical protein